MQACIKRLHVHRNENRRKARQFTELMSCKNYSISFASKVFPYSSTKQKLSYH